MDEKRGPPCRGAEASDDKRQSTGALAAGLRRDCHPLELALTRAANWWQSEDMHARLFEAR